MLLSQQPQKKEILRLTLTASIFIPCMACNWTNISIEIELFNHFSQLFDAKHLKIATKLCVSVNLLIWFSLSALLSQHPIRIRFALIEMRAQLSPIDFGVWHKWIRAKLNDDLTYAIHSWTLVRQHEYFILKLINQNDELLASKQNKVWWRGVTLREQKNLSGGRWMSNMHDSMRLRSLRIWAAGGSSSAMQFR